MGQLGTVWGTHGTRMGRFPKMDSPNKFILENKTLPPPFSLSSLFFYFHQAAFFDPLCLPPPSTFSSYTPWGQLVTWEGVPIVHTENTRILKKGESWISF